MSERDPFPRLSARVNALEAFFARLDRPAPEPLAEILVPFPALRAALQRAERRIVFAGALKTGKSSLINALIGAPLLPVRPNRATGAITTLRYAEHAGAQLSVADGEDQIRTELPFDDIARHILLDLSPGNHESGAHQVEITVPVPLLRTGGILVDTPGLADDPHLTERTSIEVERADLVVMVLAADKILSAPERALAARVHGLHHGAIVYVVNRIDLIDREDREEVVEWARASLAGSGNRLIGNPRLFIVSSDRSRSEGVDAFRAWLTHFLTAPVGDAVTLLARLGVLERALHRSATEMAAHLAQARETVRIVAEREAATRARRRNELHAAIAAARTQMETRGQQVSALVDRFVVDCTEETARHVEPGKAIQLTYDWSLQRYTDGLRQVVQTALLGAPIDAPPWDLRGWIVRAQVEAASHPATELGAALGDLATRIFDGGSIGREAGASIGSWIGKNVFGVDIQAETHQRIERAVRALVPSLRAETDRYVALVLERLDEAARLYDQWIPDVPELRAAEETEALWSEWFHWSAEFLEAVQRLLRELDKGPE